MAEQPVVPVAEEAPKKKSKTWLIVLIVLIVLCCLCVGGGGLATWLWNNGDELFGLTRLLAVVI
jgi:flagellar basal body-associated protein FliL